MRILVISQYYYPEQFKINDICKKFVEDGNSVTVLTGLPNYPEGKIFKGYLFKKRKENIDGVNIVRSFEIPRSKSILKLALNYISFMISASIKTLFMGKKFDIIFVYQLSPITMVVPAVIMKKLTRKPLYLYSCDIWPESLKVYIKSENNMVFKVLKKISKHLYNQCDAISVTSKLFIEYFANVHGITRDKISYIPQHGDEIVLNLGQTVDNDIVDFVFMGNIGKYQNIDCILKSVKLLEKESQFKVHFVGSGSFLSEAKEMVKDFQIGDKVVFHGRYPKSEMEKFYNQADACLLTLKNENLIGQTVPAKLQGYMAAGKTVIGAINGSAKEIIEESNCGMCVDSGNFIGLANLMKLFINNKSKYANLGTNGREYFELNFTLDIYMDKINNIINDLIKEDYNV